MLPIFLACAVLAVALVVLAVLARSQLVTCMGPTRLNPSVSPKTYTLSTVAAIDADTDDADAAAGYFELPRGAENVYFDVLSTLNTGFSTGTNFFVCQILGTDDPTGTFEPIAGCVTAELVVDVGQQIPSAANAPGVRLPRFLKARWDETGTMTSFSGRVKIHFDLPGGAGIEHDFDERGG